VKNQKSVKSKVQRIAANQHAIPLKTGGKGITFALCPESLKQVECGEFC